MFAEKRGTDRKENKICPECGAGAEKPSVFISQSKDSTLPENTAGLLCHILGWVTGIVFSMIDKRPFVRSHAMQSIVTFGAISLFSVIFSSIISIVPYGLWRLLNGVNTMIGLGSLVLAVFLILQAHQGKYYKLASCGRYGRTAGGEKRMIGRRSL